MANLKTSLTLELNDKISNPLKSISAGIVKLAKAGDKLGSSFNKQARYLDKSTRLLNNYQARLKLTALKTKELQNINKEFAKKKGSVLGIVATGASLAAPLAVTRQRQLMEARLGTVLPEQGRKEQAKEYQKSGREFARTGLANYQEFIDTSYNLLSAGMGDASKQGAKTVLKVAKITGGTQNADLVASSLATASNNFGVSLERVGDLATKTQFKFQLKDFAQLDEGLKNVGASAASVKLPLEQTLTALGMLNSAGVTGSNAGTSLNAVLRQLNNAKDLLGVDIVRDKGGNLDLLATLKQIDNVTKHLDLDSKAKVFQQVFQDEGKKGLLPLIANLDKFSSNLEDVSENSKGIVNKEIMGFTELLDTDLKSLSESTLQFADSIGNALLPVVKPIIKSLARLAGYLAEFGFKYPVVAKAVYGLTFAFVGLSLAVRVFSLATITARWLSTSFSLAILKNTFLLKAYRGVLLITSLALKGVALAFRALTLVMASNPIGFLLVTLTTLAVLVIANWDKVKQWFVSFGQWFKNSEIFKLIQKGVELVKGVFGGGEVKVSNEGVNKVKEASAIGANGTNANNTNNNQKINVTINSSSANPEEVAERVIQKVNEKQALSYAGS